MGSFLRIPGYPLSGVIKSFLCAKYCRTGALLVFVPFLLPQFLQLRKD